MHKSYRKSYAAKLSSNGYVAKISSDEKKGIHTYVVSNYLKVENCGERNFP